MQYVSLQFITHHHVQYEWRLDQTHLHYTFVKFKFTLPLINLAFLPSRVGSKAIITTPSAPLVFDMNIIDEVKGHLHIIIFGTPLTPWVRSKAFEWVTSDASSLYSQNHLTLTGQVKGQGKCADC